MSSPVDTKLLGKIAKARFGRCGYQESQFGLTLQFEGAGWGVVKNVTGGWDYDIPAPENGCWNEKDRRDAMSDMVQRVSKVLRDAKVDSVDELKGIPVVVEFDSDGLVKGWRILTEVL